ncbi:MAG: ABC transporter ATP-binding protein/permease [Candidatus Pacebacteria bacterium]|jgi:ATP-binding cassette subfamily B protein|nr:ABC transporter ATP-binding protein/permease [Candidatus Paceibacterota bacterium]
MPSIPKTPWRFLYFGVAPKGWFFGGALFLIAVAAILHQATPYLFKLIVDAVSVGDTSLVPLYVALYPLTFLLIQVMYRLAALLVAQVCIVGKEYLYNQLSAYMLEHSQSYFADRMAGTLMSKIGGAANAFENFIEYLLWNYLDAAITFTVTILFIGFVSPATALVLTGVFVVLFFLNYKLSGRAQAYSTASADAQSKQGGVIVDILGNASIVRQFARAKAEKIEIAQVSATARRAEFTVRYYGELLLVLNGLVITLGFSAMMWVLLDAFAAGTVTVGDMVFVLSLLMGMAFQLLFLGTAFQGGSQQFGQLKDAINELLLPHDIKDDPTSKPLHVSTGTVAFDQVTFSYGSTAVFREFSLMIPGGQRIGLVGSSGAGKSTLVSLLLRQHDVSRGVISIDGQALPLVTQESLRQAIAVVPQEPSLFHRTIKQNISYGKGGATDEEIIAVAKKAYAHDFIMTLPQQYDTLVGERGVKLSGGQKQRIAIARAMLKDAPLLILDEATSALDSESEVTIQQALHTLMVGKTVIAIAHRLSTLREMDRIVVMEDGVIIEDGTHESLLAYGGKYAMLWQHQAGGFVGQSEISLAQGE